jgi:hypothetical protein
MCTTAVQKANWDGSGIYYELQLGLDHCMQSFILALTQLSWNLSRYQDIFWATKEDHNLSLKKILTRPLPYTKYISIYMIVDAIQLRAKATATSLSSIFIQTAYGVYMSQALVPSPAPTCKTIDLYYKCWIYFYEPNQNWTCLYNTKTICILDLIEYTSVKSFLI